MIQIILPILFLIFGLFLKQTSHPGFRNVKRFSTMFIILGISTLTAKFILMYLESRP